MLLAFYPLCLTLHADPLRGDASVPDPPASVPDYNGAGAVLAPLPSGAPHVLVPVLHSAPTLADFLPPSPTAPVVRRMLRIPTFIQRYPDDGSPSTEPTVAYLGYTHEYLYVA
ncbi:MAG TPA: hypothetical protein VFJ52_08790, partial [Terriglobia bacterium]|nr:hypothetical protein [Terriglobia bacterium]